jgi:hypothetical protein
MDLFHIFLQGEDTLLNIKVFDTVLMSLHIAVKFLSKIVTNIFRCCLEIAVRYFPYVALSLNIAEIVITYFPDIKTRIIFWIYINFISLKTNRCPL